MLLELEETRREKVNGSMSEQMTAVLLDVSGVLRDNRQAMWRSFNAVLTPVGFDFERVFSGLGSDRQKSLAAYRLRGLEKYNLVENCIEAFWALQQQGVTLAAALQNPERIDAAVSAHPFSAKKEWAQKVKADFRRTDPSYLDSVPEVRGAREALYRLSAKYALGVVSNSGTAFNRAWLDRHGLSGFFRVFVSEQDVSRKKPHPDGIALACRRLFIRPPRCYYVGDAQSDMVASTRAGCVPIGVSSGTATGEQLQRAGAVRIYDDLWRFSLAV